MARKRVAKSSVKPDERVLGEGLRRCGVDYLEALIKLVKEHDITELSADDIRIVNTKETKSVAIPMGHYETEKKPEAISQDELNEQILFDPYHGLGG